MKTNFTKQKKQEWIDALRSGKYNKPALYYMTGMEHFVA